MEIIVFFVDTDDYISVDALEILDRVLRTYDQFGLERMLNGNRIGISTYKNCTRIVVICDVLYSYVMNDTSMVHTVTPANFQPSYLLYKNVSDFLVSEGIDDFRCILEIRTLYAQKLLRDVLQIAKFKCAFQEKVRILGEVVSNSGGILSKPIDDKVLRRRKLYT